MNYILKRAKEMNLPVVEATEPLPITLSYGDIEKACQKDSSMCAFSRAAKRNHRCANAYFLRSTAYIEYKDKVVKYQLPPSMQKEIVSFDRSKVMAPGHYRLSPVCPSQYKDKQAERDHKRKARAASEKRALLAEAKKHPKTSVGKPKRTRDAFDAQVVSKSAKPVRKSHRTTYIRTGQKPA